MKPPHTSKMFLNFFFANENMKKPASKVAKPAQIQPKSQFLFHKNLPPQDFSTMTSHLFVLICLILKFLYLLLLALSRTNAQWGQNPFHNIMEKLRIVNNKYREKLARARHLIYCIKNSCDVCYLDDRVPFE